MAYCILRMAKIKSRVSLARAAQHNTRERPPVNADADRSKQNWTFGGSVAEVMERYEKKLPEKVRKNAVHAVELVMTASPEFAGDWDRYLKACDGWAARLFGQENVLHVAHHLDESTPHTQVLVMPMKDGKLNAKHFIGGSRDRLIELQNDFYKQVGMSAGLERGQSRAETKAQHTPHTLAVAATKLEEREKAVKEVRDELKKIIGEDPQKVKTKLQTFNRRTPTDLRMLAKHIEAKGCQTVGEWFEVMDAQRQQQQQLPQGKKIKR